MLFHIAVWRNDTLFALPHRPADFGVVQHFQHLVRHLFQLRQEVIFYIEFPQRRVVPDLRYHMAAIHAVCQIQYPPERQITAVVLIQIVKLHLHQTLESHGIHIAECTELLCQCVELVQIVPIKMWGEKFISTHVLHLPIGFLPL